MFVALANCMTFNPLINFPRPHKVGDWIKDLDGRTTHQPHSTLSLRSHKIPHHILPPLLLDEFGPSSNIGFWSVQDIQREWVQSKQRRLRWFLWPLHDPMSFVWIFGDWPTVVRRRLDKESIVKEIGENVWIWWVVRVSRSQEGCQCDQEITLFFLLQKTAPFLTGLWRKSE